MTRPHGLARPGAAAAALCLGSRELVAIVGSGGKTSLLQFLARELAGAGNRVVATTTTAMFLEQLTCLGPIVVQSELTALQAELTACFELTDADGHEVGEAGGPGARIIAVATDLAPDGKVVGVPSDWPGRIFADRTADYVLVEADGSQHKSLKAFAAHEPVVPPASTVIVQVAGLDVVGEPLSSEFVHRAEILSQQLGVAIGTPLTMAMFRDCLLEQVREIRRRWPATRIVTVLNKADGPTLEAAGSAVAEELLLAVRGPDSAVVASCREGSLRRVAGESEQSGAAVGAASREGDKDAPFVTAIVLAAGRAERMGRQKLLLPFRGRPLVRWAVEAALGSKAEETIVVVGSEADQVSAALDGLPIRLVRNVDYAQGMSTSLKAGVKAASDGRDAVLFILGDQPLVSSAVVDDLIGAFARDGKSIVRPLVKGRPAHPVLMSADLIPEILGETGDLGGRFILERRAEDVWYVQMDEEPIDLDVDSREDYESLLGMEEMSGPGSGENT